MSRFDGDMPHGQCLWCRHLKNIPERRCAAYPDGVPAAIWSGQRKHDRPVEGDGGIQYEPRTAPFDVAELGISSPALVPS